MYGHVHTQRSEHVKPVPGLDIERTLQGERDGGKAPAISSGLQVPTMTIPFSQPHSPLSILA